MVSLRNWLKVLVLLALGLPVVQCVLIWVCGLVARMGDQAGAAFVGHVSTACLAVWSVSIVGLVLVLALAALLEEPKDDDSQT